MDDSVQDILAKRRQRVIAIILGVKERECDMHLPPEASAKLRKVILDQVNEYYELVLDLTQAPKVTGESGVILNQFYLEKIDALYAVVVTNGNSDVAVSQ